MPAQQQGSVFKTKTGYGIRWYADDGRQQRSGFKTKTQARRWWAETIQPRLGRGGPSNAIALEAFVADVFMPRWSAGKATRTVASMNERLAPALERFGAWSLAELEGAVDDVAAWRSEFPSDHARYRHTRALRQVLNAAVRWRYVNRNPAADVGANAQPHAREIQPFTRAEIDAIAAAIDPRYAGLVIFAAETGLRTQEWTNLERRDIDRRAGVVIVRERKTDRHVVPLTPRAEAALDLIPARLDTRLAFSAPGGGPIDIDNFRRRIWYPR